MEIYVTILISEDEAYWQSLWEFINEYDWHVVIKKGHWGNLLGLITGHALFSLLLSRTIRVDLCQASLSRTETSRTSGPNDSAPNQMSRSIGKRNHNAENVGARGWHSVDEYKMKEG